MKVYDFTPIPSDRIAAIGEDGVSLSYGDLTSLSSDFEQIVESRRVCLIFTKNSIDCFAGLVALMNCGVVPLLVDLNTDTTFIEQLITVYAPEYVFAPISIAKIFTSYVAVTREGEYGLFFNEYSSPNIVHPDLALLLSTSGSTGSPKLVRQSYSNLKSNGSSIIECLGIVSADRPITSLPMHYTYGFSVINSHLMAGATILITNRSVMEQQFWNFFRKNSATSISGVPYTYMIFKRLTLNRMELTSLRAMTQAGGKLAKPIIEEFARFSDENGIRFFVMYGQTEATARMSYVPADFALTKAGSIGIPIPNGEFFIADGENKLIESPNHEGHLGYRGPNVSMGYAGSRLDLSKGDENGGTLLTGDIAYRDSDGFYFITGRISRFVKVFGKRVSLDEIEQRLETIVGETACTGVEDEVSIWITNASKQEIVRKHIAGLTGIHSSAFKVYVLGSLPRNLSGKIDYQNLTMKEPHD